MGRNRAKLDEWELWVIEEDRELYQKNPNEALTMEIRHLSKREVERLSTLRDRALKHPSKKKEIEDELLTWFSENIRNVSNYVIDDEPILDGADLFHRGEPDIKQEATLALMVRGSLDEGLAKKLRPPSASLSVPRQSIAGGGAQSVTTPSQLDTTIRTETIPSSGLRTEKSNDSEDAATGDSVQSSLIGPLTSISAPIDT